MVTVSSLTFFLCYSYIFGVRAVVGDGQVLKLTDLGLSQLKEESQSAGTAKACGTWAWMAPELNADTDSDDRDDGEGDKKVVSYSKVDIYALGITAWETVTSQTPFEKMAVGKIISKVKNGKRPPIPEDCPEGLKRLIESCWDGDPAVRPDANTILRDANAVLESL